VQNTVAQCYLARVIQVGRFIPEALAEILRKTPMSEEKITFAWRSAVGATMDRGTSVVFDKGVLRVSTNNAAWRREVERSETLIRSRLDALLGRGIIRAIEVAPDPAARQKRYGSDQ
jgi:hypothetical protein